jgi:hypothetical protein
LVTVAFQTQRELCNSLISFYEGILKISGAGCRPKVKIIKRCFAGKSVVDSVPVTDKVVAPNTADQQ